MAPSITSIDPRGIFSQDGRQRSSRVLFAGAAALEALASTLPATLLDEPDGTGATVYLFALAFGGAGVILAGLPSVGLGILPLVDSITGPRSAFSSYAASPEVALWVAMICVGVASTLTAITPAVDSDPSAAAGAPPRPLQDSDGDGIADVIDNCLLDANADQENRDQDGVGDKCDGDRTEPSPVALAPLVWLHSQERFFPMRPSFFIEHSKLAFVQGPIKKGRLLVRERTLHASPARAELLGEGGYCQKIARVISEACGRGAVSTADRTRPFDKDERPHGLLRGEGFVLDLDDRYECGENSRWKRPRLRFSGNWRCSFESMPVFYDYRPRQYVTYWFFFGLSAPIAVRRPTRILTHEGDWERIDVCLNAVNERPLFVVYYQHRGAKQSNGRSHRDW